MSRTLWIAGTNPHKVGELTAMLTGLRGVVPIGVASLGHPPGIAETAADFTGNALLKARGTAAFLAGRGIDGADRVLADDSGICVDALDGEPGVRSARFARPEAGDAENNAMLVARLAALGLTDSPAHYTCVLALVRVDGQGEPLVVEGRCDGTVRAQARGTEGFGYDPHFWIDAGARTFAELAPAEKAARSHRGAAVRALLAAAPAWLSR